MGRYVITPAGAGRIKVGNDFPESGTVVPADEWPTRNTLLSRGYLRTVGDREAVLEDVTRIANGISQAIADAGEPTAEEILGIIREHLAGSVLAPLGATLRPTEEEPSGETTEPASPEPAGTPLPEEFPGLEALTAAGFTTLERVRAAPDQELLAVSGVGRSTLRSIREAQTEGG